MVPAPGPPSYRYAAAVLAVHDGDTFTAALRLRRERGIDRDLGLHVHVEAGWLTVHAPIRLLGCNAPELATAAGPAARDHLAGLLGVGCVVETHVDGLEKYGRLLGRPFAGSVDVVAAMIADGFAAPWDGHGPRPVP